MNYLALLTGARVLLPFLGHAVLRREERRGQGQLGQRRGGDCAASGQEMGSGLSQPRLETVMKCRAGSFHVKRVFAAS